MKKHKRPAPAMVAEQSSTEEIEEAMETMEENEKDEKLELVAEAKMKKPKAL